MMIGRCYSSNMNKLCKAAIVRMNNLIVHRSTLAKSVSKSRDQVNYDPKGICNPVIPPEEIEKINSVIGLNVGLTFVAWARMEVKENNLTHLEYLTFSENFHKMEPNEIYFLAVKLLHNLPQADRFVMESCRKGISNTGGHLHLSLQISRFQMISTLVTLLNEMKKNAAEQYPILFLRNRLFGKIFDLFIGNELISCKDTVMSLLIDEFTEQPNLNTPVCTVKSSEQIVAKYKKAPDVGKEMMGRAFLETLTFTELIIRKNPVYLKKLYARHSSEIFDEKNAA